MAIAQLYRDRSETENVFDAHQESGGLNRFHHSRVINARELMARITALIYNWWSVFTRMATPNRHTEATTSRPTAAARYCTPDPARQPDHRNDYQQSRQSACGGPRAGSGKHIAPETCANCGAVEPAAMLALTPALYLPRLAQDSGPRALLLTPHDAAHLTGLGS